MTGDARSRAVDTGDSRAVAVVAFGDLVKQLREAQHLTQNDLAALMGMPTDAGRVTIAQWETGARRPKAEQAPKLAACLAYWPIKGSQRLRRLLVQRTIEEMLDA